MWDPSSRLQDTGAAPGAVRPTWKPPDERASGRHVPGMQGLGLAPCQPEHVKCATNIRGTKFSSTRTLCAPITRSVPAEPWPFQGEAACLDQDKMTSCLKQVFTRYGPVQSACQHLRGLLTRALRHTPRRSGQASCGPRCRADSATGWLPCQGRAAARGRPTPREIPGSCWDDQFYSKTQNGDATNSRRLAQAEQAGCTFPR